MMPPVAELHASEDTATPRRSSWPPLTSAPPPFIAQSVVPSELSFHITASRDLDDAAAAAAALARATAPKVDAADRREPTAMRLPAASKAAAARRVQPHRNHTLNHTLTTRSSFIHVLSLCPSLPWSRVVVNGRQYYGASLWFKRE